MKAVFLENCEVWRMKACPNEEIRNLYGKYGKKVLEGKKIDLPDRDRLEELNEICSKCIHALQIDEAVCPICGSDKLTKPRFDLRKTRYVELYFYYCKKCGRNLYSNKIFL